MLDLSDFLLIRGTNYMRYTHSSFPYVELSQLKRLADALSLIIIPVDYSNFINVVKNNIDSNKGNSKKVSEESEYWSKIYTLYNKFIKKIDRQAAYILAPVNYYNLYYEAVSKEVMSKYFPECFAELQLMFELLLPSQRFMLKTIRQLILAQKQLFRDSEQTASWFKSMSKEISEMAVQNMRTSQYLYEKLLTKQDASPPVISFDDMARSEVVRWHLPSVRVPNGTCLYDGQGVIEDEDRHKSCKGTDPLIFSIERDVDVSSKNSDDVKANLGFVFGPKMPDEFFTEKGLTKTLYKTFLHKDITHTFIPKD